MRTKILILAALAATALPAQVLVAAPARAAVSAAAGLDASTYVASTPDQTLTFAITITRSGTLSRLVLPLPHAAGTSGTPTAASNVHGARLQQVSGGFVVRATTPYAVAAGTRLWVMVNAVRTPPAGSVSTTVTAQSTSGAVLARGTTPARTFTTPTPCPSVWPRDTVVAENRRPGTTAWRLAATAYDPAVAAGFASRTSARCGDTVTFRVTSNDDRIGVGIYRMGYYGGAGARPVWTSRSAIRGFRQPTMPIVALDSQGRRIDMPTGRSWIPTFSVRIDGRFPPGAYLVRITGVRTGKGAYVPLIVRDDAGTHDRLVLDSVATWQAYNTYGGASAYSTPVRSKRVSLDRPYSLNQGSGNFLDYEYGFVFWAEKQGFDLNYAADIDLHGEPSLARRARTLVLLSHAEYWSTSMRRAVEAALAAGTDLASFGANQVYWRVNPQPSSSTGADREFEIFRTGDTARFRDPPDPNPEQLLLGAMFGCPSVDAAVTPDGTWLWQGVSRQPVPHYAQGEVDNVAADTGTPAGLQVLSRLPLAACNGSAAPRADIVAVDPPSSGRVFNASTHAWVCQLVGSCPWPGWTPTGTAVTQMGQATMNVFSWLDSGAAAARTAAPATAAPLAHFRPQRVGVLRPSSGLPPLDPPLEGG